MLTTTADNHGFLYRVSEELKGMIESRLIGDARAWINRLRAPPPVQAYLDHLSELVQVLQQAGPQNVDDKLLPYLKSALLTSRRNEANEIERQKRNTAVPAVLAHLDQYLKPFDDETRTEWFRSTSPAPVPRLTEVVTIEVAEKMLVQSTAPSDRRYDEKFHILQAPDLFLPDLEYQRRKCEVRSVPIGVAFLDIDDFKSFNTAHGETHVDRFLLPTFMAALESHVYSHGYAYRFGGDEYVLLLPNSDRELTVQTLRRLQERLSTLAYNEIRANPTISIGYCEVSTDCPLTNREVLQRAERAKKHAKDTNKGSISTYLDEMMEACRSASIA
jgi:diguanylate cyclase (GGDEF)-like protein